MDRIRVSDSKDIQRVTLIYGYDREIAQWVANELEAPDAFHDPIGGHFAGRSIGVLYDGVLIAGVVYSHYRPPSIEMSIASKSPLWANRRTLRAFFDYPFNELGCKRVTALVDSHNHAVRRFDERLGFRHEGTLRQGHPSGDAEIYGMLKHECRWIRKNCHGQKKQT